MVWSSDLAGGRLFKRGRCRVFFSGYNISFRQKIRLPCLPSTNSMANNSSCLLIPQFPMDSIRTSLSAFLNDLDATTGLVESYIRMESLISTLCAALTILIPTEMPDELLRLERVFLTYASVVHDLNEAGITSASMQARKTGIISSVRRGLDPAEISIALSDPPMTSGTRSFLLGRVRSFSTLLRVWLLDS